LISCAGRVSLLILALLGTGNAGEGPSILALRGGRILSARGGALNLIPRGTVLIQEGRILAVGEDLPVPPGAEIIELEGGWVLPGFIDAHSQLGARGESDEVASAVTEDLRLLDAFDPWDPEIEQTLRVGVTAAALSPGDRNVIGGRVTVIKLIPGRVPVRAASERSAVKASLGRGVLGARNFPRYPTSQSGAMELFGRWLAARKTAAPPPASARAPERPLPVLLGVENRSQAERALALLRTAGRDAILLGGRSLDARALERLDPPCPLVLGPFDLADPRLLLSGPAALERMGRTFAFAGAGSRRDLLTSAVLAMRAGLSRGAALSALTDAPARLYGLGSRLGRLETGADADLVVWSGDPFTLEARVEQVLIDGETVFKQERAQRRSEPGREPAPPRPAAPRPPELVDFRRLPDASAGEEPALLIRARRLHPVSSPPIDGGRILVRGGRIEAVGRELEAPPGVQTIDFDGEVFPGLVDGGAPLAIRGLAAEEFRELTPEVRAADGVDRDSRELIRALRAGVTTAAITPGDRNVIGGLGAVMKTAPGRRAGDVLRGDAFLSASLTEAATDGNVNLRFSPPFSFYHRLPTTRMGTVFLLRRSFFEALDLGPPGDDAAGVETLGRLLTPAGKDVLAGALRGGMPLRLAAQSRQEIEAALRIASDFPARVTLEGFAEGMGLIPQVAARKWGVLLAPLDPGDEPNRGSAAVTLRLSALLDEAGVEFGFASREAAAVPQLRERLSLSLRSGLDAAKTLRAATLGAARLLGVADRVGSLEPGKDADLVAVRGGGPLDPGASVEWVMVDGKIYPSPDGKTQ
jgi:imidazolonepropionase-like amidohydrolase